MANINKITLAVALSVLSLSVWQPNTAQAGIGKFGQGLIDTARGKKSKSRDWLNGQVQGPIDVIRGKNSEEAEKLLNRSKGIADALVGKKSAERDKVLHDIKTGVKKTGYWIDENKEAIAVVAAVAFVGYAACIDGCTFLLGVGDATIKLGAYNAAATAGAVAGGISVSEKELARVKTKEGIESAPEKSADETDIELENRLARMKWSFGGYTYSAEQEGNSDLENLYEGAKDAFEDFKEFGPRAAGLLGAISVVFSPSEIAVDKVPTWELEKNARMDRVLVDVMREKNLISAAEGDLLYTSVKNGRLTLTVAPLQERPELKAGREEPIVIVKPQSFSDRINTKAQIIAVEVGTTAEEIHKRVEAGMVKDKIQR